jgi:hypothetical protein
MANTDAKLTENVLEQVPQQKPKLIPELLGEFQKITDPKERKAFYHSHPLLAQVYSEGNFHGS